MVLWRNGCFCCCILVLWGSIPARLVRSFFVSGGGFLWYTMGGGYKVGGFLVGIGGALSAVRAQCNYFGFSPY